MTKADVRVASLLDSGLAWFIHAARTKSLSSQPGQSR
jgi:hypothetical protein